MSDPTSIECCTSDPSAVLGQSASMQSYAQTAGCISESVLHLHTGVLFKESCYFQTIFSTSVGERQRVCPRCKAHTDVAYLVMEGRELEAAHYVLKYMYTKQLPTHDGEVRDGMLPMYMLMVSDC